MVEKVISSGVPRGVSATIAGADSARNEWGLKAVKSKKRKPRAHGWRHGQDREHDELSEHRTCRACLVTQYAYGDTSEKFLFWLPEVTSRCPGKPA